MMMEILSETLKLPLRPQNISRHEQKPFGSYRAFICYEKQSILSRYPSFHKEALVMKFTDPDAKHIFEDVEKK
jgi:hypothetical protein